MEELVGPFGCPARAKVSPAELGLPQLCLVRPSTLATALRMSAAFPMTASLCKPADYVINAVRVLCVPFPDSKALQKTAVFGHVLICQACNLALHDKWGRCTNSVPWKVIWSVSMRRGFTVAHLSVILILSCHGLVQGSVKVLSQVVFLHLILHIHVSIPLLHKQAEGHPLSLCDTVILIWL